MNINEKRRQRLLDRGLFSTSDILGSEQLIISGTVIGLVLEGQTKLPTFQFDNENKPLPGIAKVLKIFGDHLTDWEKAIWFITPNGWLKGKEPIDLIRKNKIDVVLEAASDEVNPGIY